MALGLVILPFTIVQQQAVAITVDALQSSGFTADFAAPSGNMPGTYNNNMFLWTATSDPPVMVPWYSAPTASSSMTDGITTATVSPPSGNTFPANPYVLGFSVGPSVTAAGATTYPDVCATAMVPASWDTTKVTYFTPNIGIVGVTTNTVMFSYSLPQGAIPSQNNTWIGVWRNVMPLYNVGRAPLGFAQVNQPDSTGNQVVIFTPGLSPNTMYTAGLFTSGWSKTAGSLVTTALAATVSFQTGKG